MFFSNLFLKRDFFYCWPTKLSGTLVFAIFFLFISFFATHSAYSEILSVKGDKVNLREDPNRDSSIKWEYGSGFPLEVIRRQDKWVKVKDFENDEGWIHKSLLSKKKYVIVNTNKNNKQTINIRTGPGVSYPVSGKAHYGVVFELKEKSDDWIKVEHESGLTGWIKNNLVWGSE